MSVNVIDSMPWITGTFVQYVQVLNITVFQYLLGMPSCLFRCLCCFFLLVCWLNRCGILFFILKKFSYICLKYWETEWRDWILVSGYDIQYTIILSIQPLISNSKHWHIYAVHQRCAQCFPIFKSIKVHAIETSTETEGIN